MSGVSGTDEVSYWIEQGAWKHFWWGNMDEYWYSGYQTRQDKECCHIMPRRDHGSKVWLGRDQIQVPLHQSLVGMVPAADGIRC
jgi:hypothetical protein